MAKKNIKDIDVKNRKVLVRVDFNVPVDRKTGKITDESRIRGALPTIRYLLDQNARVILVSHRGRPKGKFVPELKMDVVAEKLRTYLDNKVIKIDSIIGPEAEKAAEALKPGELLLLENVRMDSGETKNDPEFARQLAGLAEIFVNDAFGTAHRKHASTAGVCGYLPSAAGFLLAKEIEHLGKAAHDPSHPYVVIIGGAKVSDKIGVIRNLLEKADVMLIGGGMANTFLKASGCGTGTSLVEDELTAEAAEIMKQAEENHKRIILPVDGVVADRFEGWNEIRTVPTAEIPADMMMLDIGPETVELFSREIAKGEFIVWNGPMGVFEKDDFASGTMGIADAVANASGYSVVGGGDSAAALTKSGLSDRINHISTGGGASLEFLEGKALPGIECLDEE